MTATAVRPTTIKLDEATKARVKRLAEARRRTPHWMILEAIHQYVEREEQRETLRQDALQAWNDYRETGLHASFEEADAWLGKLADGEDAEPPECHA